jgi:hypothetical protein
LVVWTAAKWVERLAVWMADQWAVLRVDRWDSRKVVYLAVRLESWLDGRKEVLLAVLLEKQRVVW